MCSGRDLLLAGHKGAGADLDAAFQQAADCFEGLTDKELPRCVVVSDFQRFVLHDLLKRDGYAPKTALPFTRPANRTSASVPGRAEDSRTYSTNLSTDKLPGSQPRMRKA